MIKQWLTLSLVFMVYALVAQPVNDNCSGLIDLGVAPACPTQLFSNVAATATDIGFGNNPSCFNGGTPQRDVWFAFTTSDTIFDYTITLTGTADGATPSIVNPQIAIYRGDCELDGLAELSCVSAELGETSVELDIMGLTPNVTYFLRINDYSASATPNQGSFLLCVDEMDPINFIDDGSSTACTGQLYDTGGPDGDYGANENNVFTICPSQPNACITFTLEYFNIEPGTFFGGDQLIFYDDNEVNPGAIITDISGEGFGFGNVSAGGAVCFQVQASSGCLTVQFISDEFTNFQGFSGSWECSTQPCEPYEPITVSSDVDNLDIVDAFATPQTQVTITSINCSEGSYGVFNAGDNSDLGLDKGLLLTTGDLEWAPGPNSSTGFGNIFADRFFPGDADLDSLSLLFGDGTLSQDACILELDVLASTDELTFEYIFGSDEYPEYVGDQFNDIFAFLISGPGITGLPQLNNQLNIATLPNPANTVVQINSVNNLQNWEYYRNNELGLSMEYDGFTSDFLGVKKSLTARSSVIPCNTYHLKLAIADRGDGLFDSGVFISDIRGGTPDITVRFNSGIDYLLEACTEQPDDIIVRLNNPVEDTVTYNIVIGGTATPGEDYILNLPSTITFLPGETEFSFPITVLTDLNDMEGTETLLLSLTNDFGCGEVTYTTLRIEIRDQLRVEINAGQDTAYFCPGGSLQLAVDGAANYFWTPVAIFDNPLSATPVVSPGESRWVRVEGQVGPSCIAVDSIYLQLVDPSISLQALDPIVICRGESVRLESTNNANNSNLSWEPEIGLSDPNSPNPIATPLIDQLYIVSVNVTGCIASDSVFIDVDFLNLPELASDTVLCQNYPVTLASLVNFNTDETTYSWTPTVGLDDPTSPTPLATPDVTTTYQLIATTLNGACADTSSMTISLLAADVDITPQDTAYICLGEIAQLSATTNTGNATGLVWSPANGLNSTTGLNVTATLSQSQWYFTQFTNGACTVFDSVYVRVDSLPTDLNFTFNPQKDVYCFGEQVIISSPIYDPANFPAMTHLWTQAVGALTPDSLYNLVFSTTDTALYQRITLNNACRDTIGQIINVIEPILPRIVPADTTLCNGQGVNLTVLHGAGSNVTYEWQEPTAGLSCTNCPNPVAIPPTTTTYQVQTEIDGECPESASVVIEVIQPPFIQLIPSVAVCPSVPRRLLTSLPEAGTTYSWSSPDDPNFSSNDPLLSVAPTVPTTYILTATNSCFTSTAQTSLVPAPITSVSIDGPSQICEGETLILQPVFTPPIEPSLAEQITWEGASSNMLTFQTVPTSSGVYNLSLSIGMCYTLQDSIEVTYITRPVPGVIPEEILCLGESRVLMNTLPEDNVTYSWSSPTDPGFNSSNPLVSVTPVISGLNTYILSASNVCANIERTVNLFVIGDTELEIQGDLTICPGSATTLQAVSIPGLPATTLANTVWTWPGGTLTGSTITVSPDATTTYTATLAVEDCGEITATATVTVLEAPMASLEAERDTVYSLGPVVITVTTEPATGNTFAWSPAPDSQSGNTFFFTAPESLDTAGTPILYALTLTTAEGCTLNTGIVIVVQAPQADIPNIFSPNGDMRNDLFKIFNADELEDIEVMVYNRWGQLVYEASNNNGWNGTYKGDPAPADVYIYRVKFKIGGEVIEKTGELTLVR